MVQLLPHGNCCYHSVTHWSVTGVVAAALGGPVVRDAAHAHPRHVPRDAGQPRQHEQGVLFAVALRQTSGVWH